MTLSELNSMTVIQLRKIARENGIVLGAGVDKSAIMDKIASTLNLETNQPLQQSILDLPELLESDVSPTVALQEVPSVSEEKESESVLSRLKPLGTDSDQLPADSEKSTPPESESQPYRSSEESAPVLRDEPHPRFQAAWHSADSPQNQTPRPTFASTGANRPLWQGAASSARQEQRPLSSRTHTFGPRFGPTASSPVSETVQEPVANAVLSPLPERRVGAAGSGSFGPKSIPVVAAEPMLTLSPSPAPEAISSQPEAGASSPSLEELLATGDFEESGGILELHPDGYGFLRANNFLPSSRDIYVSMAQIRRFSLRTGDLIQGKVRPQREGDKFAALLYIDTINGIPESEALSRPLFDELTPEYPSRRISLESKEGPSLPDMRLIDLIAPLGFGQRGLLLCPPDTGKRELLRNYANTIVSNYPDVTVLVLLIDMNPEDVTAFRESVSCPVMASTFDQAPEVHLRLTEMVVERAMRLVEQKQDVIILADSLTRLAKVYTSSAAQQGRSLPGMVNPTSLLRTKRLFGAARCMKEGGSLTVIAAMDIATGNRVDDSIVEEFKGTANMELTLDQGLVQAGISPAIQLQRSFTKNSDLLLNAQQKEGLSLIRQMLGNTSSAIAIPQLLSMMEKTSTNAELLLKMKDWFALMNM